MSARAWRGLLPRSVVVVAAAVSFASASTYAFLALTARALGPADYSTFSVYWALVVTLSLGAYLPVEQETARQGGLLRAIGQDLSGLRRASLVAVGVVTGAIAVLGLLLAIPVLHDLMDGQDGLLVLLLVVCGSYGVQFMLRGLLSSSGRLTAYASLLVVEGSTRCMIAVVLLAAGVRDVLAFGASILVAGIATVAVGWWAFRPHSAPAATTAPPVPVRPMIGRIGRLIVAQLLAQLLLNGGVLVAKAFAASDQQALAGHLLATISVARIPVFVLQPIQSSLLPRIVAATHSHDPLALRHMTVRLGAATLAAATSTVVAAAAFGPWVVGLLFGSDFTLGRGVTTLLALGTGTFVVALCASDVTVALGGHTAAARAWMVGVVVAALVVALVPDLQLRASLPLLAGALATATLLVHPLHSAMRASTSAAGRLPAG